MSTSKKAAALQIGNILAFVATLAVNGLASTSILGGKTTAQISDQYSTLITARRIRFRRLGHNLRAARGFRGLPSLT
jgi:hypothetical protein